MPYLECPNCGGEYYAKPYAIRNGKAKYCSIKCYSEYNGRKLPKSYPHMKKCAGCGEDFEIKSYRYRKRKYCSRSCAAVESNKKRVGMKYNVPTKDNAETAFRKKLIDTHGHVCMVPGCGYKTFVDAHHIIPRSEGGQHYVENGILLCPNHHREADQKLLDQETLLQFQTNWKVPVEGC